MSLIRVEVYVNEQYIKTAFVEAEDQYAAEEKVREELSIDLDSEIIDA
jgi:hypothetical protein